MDEYLAQEHTGQFVPLLGQCFTFEHNDREFVGVGRVAESNTDGPVCCFLEE